MAVDNAAPTGTIRGVANPGVAPWSTFVQQAREHVPELQWPRSIATYERILSSDAQVWGLYAGTVGPIEDYRWWVDPNGNDEARVALLAEDLGLPIGPPADGEIQRTSLPGEFDFGELLHEALLAPALSHHYFEWAGELRDGLWRLTEVAPIHPSTLTEIKSDRQGRLVHVSQSAGASVSVMGGTLFAGMAPKLKPESLIPFVFWPDATRKWIGRSLLRPLYRNWLCKDVLIRVDVTNHERAGGVPWVETDERFQGTDLSDLQRLASEFRVDEEGGAALPPGALLRLARAGGTDIVASIEYHDSQMSKVWQTMVRELGRSASGSRAISGDLGDLEALARRAIAGWAAKTLNRWVLARWWMWNYGERNAPVLRFTPPELEAAVEVEAPPAAGDDGPPSVAATAPPSPRRQGAQAARRDVDSPGRTDDTRSLVLRGASQGDSDADHGPARPASASPRGASRPSGEVAAADDVPVFSLPSRSRLPDRELRRQPTDIEVRAAVDFAAIDVAYEDAAEALNRTLHEAWLPEMLDGVDEAITMTASGSERVRLTALDMARIVVPVVGSDDLTDVLLGVARSGAAEAVAELGAQGLDLDAASETALRARVADHAKAVAAMISNGIQIAASRRAVQMAGSGMTPVQLAADVRGYIEGLAHAYERDQLSGAVAQALNGGRLEVFDRASDREAVTFYISALLDAVTCDPCAADDGREFATASEVQAVMPSGGNASCLGGARCRCTAVAVYDEAPTSV